MNEIFPEMMTSRIASVRCGLQPLSSELLHLWGDLLLPVEGATDPVQKRACDRRAYVITERNKAYLPNSTGQ